MTKPSDLGTIVIIDYAEGSWDDSEGRRRYEAKTFLHKDEKETYLAERLHKTVAALEDEGYRIGFIPVVDVEEPTTLPESTVALPEGTVGLMAHTSAVTDTYPGTHIAQELSDYIEKDTRRRPRDLPLVLYTGGKVRFGPWSLDAPRGAPPPEDILCLEGFGNPNIEDEHCAQVVAYFRSQTR